MTVTTLTQLHPAPPPELASTFTVNGGLIFGTTTLAPIPSE